MAEFQTAESPEATDAYALDAAIVDTILAAIDNRDQDGLVAVLDPLHAADNRRPS